MKTQLRKDYMNLVNKKLNNEQKLDDFISWIRCDAS
jgi:hypothetical protein